jgi:hypothetical protein
MKYSRAAHTAWRRLDDETVVINLSSKRMVGLNESGGAVWEALAAAPELAVIAGASGAEAEMHLRRFVAELAAEGLVEATAGETPTADVAPAPMTGPFVPPAITWREDLLRFGGACNKIPEESPYCNQNPRFS